MYKRAKVVMLPTNEKSRLFTGGGSLIYLNHAVDGGNGWRKQQHLYITSDDEIKEGDWCIDLDFNRIFHCSDASREKYRNSKKIIATTDSSLKVKDNWHSFMDRAKSIEISPSSLEQIEKGLNISLPQPLQQFIEKYIEEYNKGNAITDVLVEYQITKSEVFINNGVPYSSLKVNPKDNTITIKKVKDTLKDIMAKDSDVKDGLNEVLGDLAKLSTNLYIDEDVYNGKDGENLKYREQVNDIREKIKVILNCL